MGSGRFVLSFTATAAAILCCVASANYALDTNGIYHGTGRAQRAFVEQYVGRLIRSSSGLVLIPLDRAVKLELAKISTAQCVVTGSSSEMASSLETAPWLGNICASLVNLAVTGGSFEDFVTVAGILIDKPSVKTVLVGVSPWMLRRSATSEWTEVEASYGSARMHFDLEGSGETARAQLDKLTNLINGQYLLTNLTAALVRKPNLSAIIDAKEAGPAIENENRIILPDGSLVYSRSYLAARPLPEALIGDGHGNVAEPFVDMVVAQEFEHVLMTLAARGVKVMFVLIPYHPKVFRCLSQEACAAITSVDLWVRTTAARNGFEVIGGYDPRPLGLTPNLFLDDMHVAPAGLPLVHPQHS